MAVFMLHSPAATSCCIPQPTVLWAQFLILNFEPDPRSAAGSGIWDLGSGIWDLGSGKMSHAQREGSLGWGKESRKFRPFFQFCDFVQLIPASFCFVTCDIFFTATHHRSIPTMALCLKSIPFRGAASHDTQPALVSKNINIALSLIPRL